MGKTLLAIASLCIAINLIPATAPGALLITDSSKQSGIEPELSTNASSTNQLRFRNDLRRRCWGNVYLKEVTYTSGQRTEFTRYELGFSIPATQRIEGLFGTVLQVIQGNTALSPAFSNEIKLEVPAPDVAKAVYEIHVVGAGLYYQEGTEPTARDIRDLDRIRKETFFYDIFIPTIILVVSRTTASAHQYFGEECPRFFDAVDLYTKFLPLIETVSQKFLTQRPPDWQGALFDVVNFLESSTNPFYTKAIQDWLVSKVRSDMKDAARTAFENIFKGIDVSGAIAGIADLLAVLRDITDPSLNALNVWEVQVTPLTVQIKPKATTINGYSSVLLKAVLKDGSTIVQPDPSTITFLWRSENNLGYFQYGDTTGIGELQTSAHTVNYGPLSNAISGTDTVSVTVLERGDPKGTSTAKITIAPDILSYAFKGFKVFYIEEDFGT